MECETVQLIDDGDKHPIPEEHTKPTAQQNNPAMIDLENKLGIIYAVLKACIKEQNENVYYYLDYIVNRMTFLTELDGSIISGIMQKPKEYNKTDILEESVLETPETDFLIRQTLIKYYNTLNKIPKIESLIDISKELSYSYKLNEQLRRSGYIWQRLPNTKRSIIVEHPKNVLKRQSYLKKVTNYRKVEKSIIYIETKIVTRAHKDACHFQKYLTEGVNFVVVFIAVSNETGFLNTDIFFCTSIFKCQKLVENHIIKNILPSISEPSVIILEDKPYYTKSLPIPTIESEKSEMVKWLKINGLPHDEDLHRSELFEIIQRCRVKRDLHSFDAVVHADNHIIVRRPPRTDYLNYYKPLWVQYSSKDILAFIKKQNQEFWANLEISVMRTEKIVFIEDLAMENVTDKILTMANNMDVNEWANVECDEVEDTLSQDEFIIVAKNTFSPQDLQIHDRQFLFEIKKFEQKLK